MNVDHHAEFATWLNRQVHDLDLYGEIFALLGVLEILGEELLTGHDECHPVVTSPYLYALRRTPPTMTTPFATRPPVIRMLFGFILNQSSGRSAAMLVGGDKTDLGNLWYPPNIGEAHRRLRQHAITTNATPYKVRSHR